VLGDPCRREYQIRFPRPERLESLVRSGPLAAEQPARQCNLSWYHLLRGPGGAVSSAHTSGLYLERAPAPYRSRRVSNHVVKTVSPRARPEQHHSPKACRAVPVVRSRTVEQKCRKKRLTVCPLHLSIENVLFSCRIPHLRCAVSKIKALFF
jgi:hypothetical protein